MGKYRHLAGIEARFRPFGNLHSLESVGLLPVVFFYLSVLVTVNIVAIGLFLVGRDEMSAGMIALGIGGVTAIATVVYLATGSSGFLVGAEVAAGVTGVLGMHVALGGYAWSGGWLAWSLVHVTVVALFFPRLVAILLVSGYLAAVTGFAFLERFFQSLRGNPPDVAVPAVLAADTFAINVVLLALVAGTLVFLLGREQQQNLRLLGNVLPESISKRLKSAPDVIAERFDACTVLFADLVGFTERTSEVEPDRLVDELNEVFSLFDDLVARLGAEKIKTIGDGYMAVAGVPTPKRDHAEVICELALQMQSGMKVLCEQLTAPYLLRVGVATGEVVAGVIGRARFSYDLWGNTVNLASRLQRRADPGQILVSDGVEAELSHVFRFRSIGEVDLKGKGNVRAHVLEARINLTNSLTAVVGPTETDTMGGPQTITS